MDKVKKIDWSKVEEAVEDLIDLYGSDDYHEDRASKYDAYICEAAIEAVYGRTMWDWINERIQ